MKRGNRGIVWAQPGANGFGDRESTRRAAMRVNAAVGGPITTDLTGLVQGWVSNSSGNRDLLLRLILPLNSTTMTYRFASANHSDPTWRPRLVVTYTPGQAYNPSRPPDLASLSMQAAPEATPPANHTWRS